MNFEFSDDQKRLREQVRRLLAETCTRQRIRQIVDGEQLYDRALWKELAELGYLGVAIPEELGGAGAGYLELAVIAEELGRAIAPLPIVSSIYLAAEALLIAGSDVQKQQYLPSLASGEMLGTLALFEGRGNPVPAMIKTVFKDGMITGVKTPVLDGGIADIAIVAARNDSSSRDADIGLYLVDLKDKGVERRTLKNLDPTRSLAEITFKGAPAELLGRAKDGWNILGHLLDRAAVLLSFEQIGGADRTVEMARDYALDRMAFGRPIGSFQAIKHILADMYVSSALARSNAYYAAWALSSGSAELGVAAANARVSATKAFQSCSKQNIQVHGGVGATWEFDCHLYYRRANVLALGLGSPSYWEDLLIERMRASARQAA